MSKLISLARAPSNIALLKYMGKKDSSRNLPENSSLSLTLNSLCSFAEISGESAEVGEMRWIPEVPKSLRSTASPFWKVPSLSPEGEAKVIRHLERIRRVAPSILDRFKIRIQQKSACWTLRTLNTFPASSGIASSASSFAAMTLAGAAALAQDQKEFTAVLDKNSELRRELAKLSRLGSGSSCRSFEGPWVLWKEESAVPVDAHPELDVAHFVLILSAAPKEVSSSQAHQWVRSSPLWQGRPDRVEERSVSAVEALRSGDWSSLVRLAWSDSWEMHSLFHTSAVPFTYWMPETLEALRWFSQFQDLEKVQKELGVSALPLVTLDAGPNVHILVQRRDQEAWHQILRQRYPQIQILSDQPGMGAILLEGDEG